MKWPFGYDVAAFERDYYRTANDLQLQDRFDFTVLKEKGARHHDEKGSYHLCQIHVEPNSQYRMEFLRSDQLPDIGLPSIWYVWAFKKSAWGEPQEIARAIKRAEELWYQHWKDVNDAQSRKSRQPRQPQEPRRRR